MTPNPIDPARIRRESLRWYLLLAIHNARPEALCETIIESTMRAIYPDVTALEVRQQLDYLMDRDLAKIRKEPTNRWWAELTRIGTDLVEYTIDCEPGIARPPVYWQAS